MDTIPATAFGEGLFLVLSNLAFVPPIILVLWIGELATAWNFFGVFAVSSIYHSCRADFFCLYSVERLQIADYLFVWRALTWAITYIGTDPRSKTGNRQHMALYYFFTNVSFVIVLSGYQGLWLAVTGAGAPIVTVLVLSALGHRRLFTRDGWAAVTLLFGGLAGVFFALPHSDYWWAHSLWHIAAAIAQFSFLLAIVPRGKHKTQK